MSNYDPKKAIEIQDLRDAVIEAARKACKGFVSVSCIEHADNCCDDWCSGCKRGLGASTALREAVEALDQASLTPDKKP